MANRNYLFDALVIRRWPIGDAHRGVGFLTRERGPINAIAHGAARSSGRLKTLTAPIRRVNLKAYHDPVTDTWKVVDLEPVDLYGGLAEVFQRATTASLWTEILWRTQVSGEASDLFELTVQALSVLDLAPVVLVPRLNALWLWRSLDIAGMAPDFTFCTSCSAPLSGKDIVKLSTEGEWGCPACAGGRGLRLSAQAVDELLLTMEEPLENVVFEGAYDGELETFALRLWEEMIGGPLKSARLLEGNYQ